MKPCFLLSFIVQSMKLHSQLLHVKVMSPESVFSMVFGEFLSTCLPCHIIYTVNLCKTAILKTTENWFQDQLVLNAGQK